jgi:DNA mismatch repair ATPase MutS
MSLLSLHVDSSQITYSDIADISLRHCLPDTVIPTAAQGDPNRFVQRQEAILLNISDRVKKSKAFQVLNSQEQAPPPPSVISKRTWVDLNLLTGPDNQPEASLGSILNRTQTELGRSYFLGLIARPTDKLQIIKKRQAVIREFVYRSRGAAGSILKCLKKMSSGEAQLLSFWDDKMQLPGCILNQYFKYHKRIDKYCNRSSLALDINSSLETMKKLTGTAAQAASAVLLPLYALSLAANMGTPEFLEGYAVRFIGTSGPLYSLVSLIPSNFVRGSTAMIAGGFSGVGLESRVKWTKADLAIDSIIHRKMVAVAHFYRNMKEIYGLVSQNPELQKHLEHFHELESFFENRGLQNIFSVLESRTFNSEARYFFRRGNVLLAWNLLQDKGNQKEFEAALTAVAEIDALLSFASVFNEGAYCFPEYIEDQEYPILELDKVWNPLVSRSKVVENTVCLGSDNPSNGIVTGPNAAGKSTILRSLLYAIVLAQTVGISPSRQMRLTLFSHVLSAMNTSDNAALSQSLFQAQLDVMVKLHQDIESLTGRGFSFAALDELLSGTSLEESEALGFAAVEKLGRLANGINMIVTHHRRLTLLEGRSFRNYKLSVDETTLQPLYTLESGVSKQHIALAVAQARGLEHDVVLRAKGMLRESLEKKFQDDD